MRRARALVAAHESVPKPPFVPEHNALTFARGLPTVRLNLVMPPIPCKFRCLFVDGLAVMEHETSGNSSLHISDVIEVIQTTDPDFADDEYNPLFSVASPPGEDEKQHAYVEITEQPAAKALRFRYECEGRSAGSIPGASSTPDNKTYPAIRVVGYIGRAVVVVSCVTKDSPYRPHPHSLVGKEGCKRGVCTLELSDDMTATFSNLGIQCVKKRDIDEALRVREEIRVDPFRTGFAHRNQPGNIDLNAVRLCFQVFLEGSEKGKFTFQLTPVVSDPIYDKKAMSDLVICKMSDCSASVAGGKEIILLCEKVAKEDIQVRFFEQDHGGRTLWEAQGDFTPAHVHKQVAISLRTPRYRTLDVPQPVDACIQLRRPSDGASSEPLPFQLLPLDSGGNSLIKVMPQFLNQNWSVLKVILHCMLSAQKNTWYFGIVGIT
ncbi:Uncharacterized protein GBIM_01588 [Gryllus bimaculatus]|nr:Uncharacterized protein GBIM_01588 [Gryllus bimaculatus]